MKKGKRGGGKDDATHAQIVQGKGMHQPLGPRLWSGVDIGSQPGEVVQERRSMQTHSGLGLDGRKQVLSLRKERSPDSAQGRIHCQACVAGAAPVSHGGLPVPRFRRTLSIWSRFRRHHAPWFSAAPCQHQKAASLLPGGPPWRRWCALAGCASARNRPRCPANERPQVFAEGQIWRPSTFRRSAPRGGQDN